MGWTSIYQLFWGSLGTRVLTRPVLTDPDLASLAASHDYISRPNSFLVEPYIFFGFPSLFGAFLGFPNNPPPPLFATMHCKTPQTLVILENMCFAQCHINIYSIVIYNWSIFLLIQTTNWDVDANWDVNPVVSSGAYQGPTWHRSAESHMACAVSWSESVGFSMIATSTLPPSYINVCTLW